MWWWGENRKESGKSRLPSKEVSKLSFIPLKLTLEGNRPRPDKDKRVSFRGKGESGKEKV